MANKFIKIITQTSLIGINVMNTIAFILLLYRIIYNGSGGGAFEGLIFFGYVVIIVWAIYFMTILLHELFDKTNHSTLRLLRITLWILLFITLIYVAIWIHGFA